MSDPNETTAVELSDGSVMLNMRNVSPAKRRSITVSPNGYDGWSEPRFDDALPDPTCFGSLVRYDSGTILFVNAESTSSRSNITVKASYDDGRTWSASGPSSQRTAGIPTSRWTRTARSACWRRTPRAEISP